MAISLYELAQRVNSAMPLGTIVPYYGTDEPSGWKICDGRSCAGTDLAKKLGISVVPDLRGRFIRMIGGNAAGMAVAQSDCIRNITGSFVPWAYNNAEVSGAIYKSGTTYDAYQASCAYWGAKMFFDASRVVPTGPENRPINMAFNYIIKVVGTNVILYYVSNIIYKAKAHICRTFSFVKSFQREVRNSMSISLKNHEDRITELEVTTDIDTPVVIDYGTATTDRGWYRLEFCKIDKFRVYMWGIIRTPQSNKLWNLVPAGFRPNKIITTYHQAVSHGLGIQYGYKLKIHPNGNIFIESGEDFTSNVFAIWSTKAILYSFSYIIIYRLTQILLNLPFFERLTSQKGGAKAI